LNHRVPKGPRRRVVCRDRLPAAEREDEF